MSLCGTKDKNVEDAYITCSYWALNKNVWFYLLKNKYSYVFFSGVDLFRTKLYKSIIHTNRLEIHLIAS